MNTVPIFRLDNHFAHKCGRVGSCYQYRHKILRRDTGKRFLYRRCRTQFRLAVHKRLVYAAKRNPRRKKEGSSKQEECE